MHLHSLVGRSLIFTPEGRHLHLHRLSLSSVRPSLFPPTTRHLRLLRTVAPFAARSMDGPVSPDYDRHVFLCFKGPEMLTKTLRVALKARKKDIPVKTRLIMWGVCNGIEHSGGEVLIFPDMIKYKGLTESVVDSFVEDVVVHGKPWASREPETFTGSHIFVRTDGPLISAVSRRSVLEKLNEEIGLRKLKDQVFVSQCSRIGGRKFDGNLMVFSLDSEGTITPHWYDYNVTPDHVPKVLVQHFGDQTVGASAGGGRNAEQEGSSFGGWMKKMVEKLKPKLYTMAIPTATFLAGGVTVATVIHTTQKRKRIQGSG